MHAARGRMLMELDRFDDAEAALEAANRITERLGTRRAYLDVYRGFGHFATGEWDEAVTELEAGIALATETGQGTNSTLGFSILALIALHRGHLRRAGEAVDRNTGGVKASGPRFRKPVGRAGARAPPRRTRRAARGVHHDGRLLGRVPSRRAENRTRAARPRPRPDGASAVAT